MFCEVEDQGEKVKAVVLNRWTSHAKEWCGKVVGLDPKYGLALQWCKVIKRDWSRSGKNGTTTVMLDGEGFYKISNPTSGRYGREAIAYYYFNGDNEFYRVDESDVYKFFKEKEAK